MRKIECRLTFRNETDQLGSVSKKTSWLRRSHIYRFAFRLSADKIRKCWSWWLGSSIQTSRRWCYESVSAIETRIARSPHANQRLTKAEMTNGFGVFLELSKRNSGVHFGRSVPRNTEREIHLGGNPQRSSFTWPFAGVSLTIIEVPEERKRRKRKQRKGKEKRKGREKKNEKEGKEKRNGPRGVRETGKREEGGGRGECTYFEGPPVRARDGLCRSSGVAVSLSPKDRIYSL